MSVIDRLYNFWYFWQKHGTFATLTDLSDKLGFQNYNREVHFLGCNLRAASELILIMMPGFKMVEASPAIVEGVVHYDDGLFKKEQALHRLRQGHILLMGFYYDKPVTYIWIENEIIKINYIELKCELAPDVAYIRYFFTPSEYRGHGFAVQSLKYALSWMRQHGKTFVFLIVEKSNFISLKACKRAGFEIYQTCLATRRFFIRSHLLINQRGAGEHLFRNPLQSRKLVWRYYL
jgi:GNAT superfamily N-acetyltransferase